MAQVNFSDKDPNNKILTTGDVNALKHAINDNESLINNGTVSGIFDSSNQFRYNYHLIPKTNSNFDLGSAEYKIRHLYLSNNSIWIGDDNKIEASSGEVKTKKRNKNILPFYITGASTLNKTEGEVLTVLSKASVSEITLSELEQYAQTIDPNVTIENIYPREDDANYYPADFEHIFEQNDNIGRAAQTITNDGITPIAINLLQGNIVNLDNNNEASITLDIHGLPEDSFTKAQITLYVVQSTSSTSIAVQVNSKVSTLQGAPQVLRDGLNIITIDLLYHPNIWNHFVTLK